MDPATIERLVADHPERYRGGRIDRGRPILAAVSTGEAWDRARRNLDDDNPAGAAYWAGFAAAEGET